METTDIQRGGEISAVKITVYSACAYHAQRDGHPIGVTKQHSNQQGYPVPVLQRGMKEAGREVWISGHLERKSILPPVSCLGLIPGPFKCLLTCRRKYLGAQKPSTKPSLHLLPLAPRLRHLGQMPGSLLPSLGFCGVSSPVHPHYVYLE